jgi:hypothetical protein
MIVVGCVLALSLLCTVVIACSVQMSSHRPVGKAMTVGADTEFLLRAPGHPDIPLHYNGLNCSNSSKRGFAVAFDSQAPVHLIPGVQYLLVPRNQKARHEWRVVEGLKVIAP